MRKPVEQICREVKPNGLYGKTIKKHSYAILLCRKGGDDVMALRMDYLQNKGDVHKEVETMYPGYNVKGVWRLYDEDFDE